MLLITPPFCHIVNLSISQGNVPRDLKSARVVPLYKKEIKTEAGNYRPVSILSIFSKILEKTVHNQISKFFQDHNLLYEFQSGFRKSYSTDTCLIYLSDTIRSKLDKGNYCGMVMLDLRKAFDTVNHEILITKLKAMGFDNRSSTWMRSYLTGREQVVDINGVLSSAEQITCGVPQGSILGPLLFLAYVNDMKASVKCDLLLYADDSALIVSGNNILEIENILSRELKSVSEWLVDNKLSLHLGKTESILFGSKRNLKKCNKLNVQCNDEVIAPQQCVKYLGANLDQELSGEQHAMNVLKKVSARIKFIYRNSKYFDCHTSKLVASAIVQCHFDYACLFWYTGLSKATKSKLQTCQNKLIRTVLNLHPRHHLTSEHFKFLNWLPVEERVIQLRVCQVRRILNKEAPGYLSRNLDLSMNNYSHNTRANSSNSLVVPRFRTNYGKSSFVFSAAKSWNALPSSVRNTSSSSQFKVEVKKALMDQLTQQSDFVFY